MAAHAQGKFWAMHDALFESSMSLEPEAIEGYAIALGLDMQRFRADVAAHAQAGQVDGDLAHAESVGATATPVTYVNGTEIRGAQPYETFRKAIDEALAK